MPVNKNALIRYQTLDRCFRNRQRQWTLEDLLHACAEALYEYEGIRRGISLRTIQLDIQAMRSEKLGYHAPIEVYDRKYYRYSDPSYSIARSPLSAKDAAAMQEALQVLSQLQGFDFFKPIQGILPTLEDQIEGRQIIDLEKNERLKGLEWITPLYQLIQQKQCASITYKSFKAREESQYTVVPYLLKEFRNRWFLLCLNTTNELMLTLALDRMIAVTPLKLMPYKTAPIPPQQYFIPVFGVTRGLAEQPEAVVFKVNAVMSPYLITKPLHGSQEVLEVSNGWTTFKIEVILNLELEREFLGLAEAVKILSPRRLRQRIYKRLKQAVAVYENLK
jgi:predicted DNA-binding transcriptional regulator YafY